MTGPSTIPESPIQCQFRGLRVRLSPCVGIDAKSRERSMRFPCRCKIKDRAELTRATALAVPDIKYACFPRFYQSLSTPYGSFFSR